LLKIIFAILPQGEVSNSFVMRALLRPMNKCVRFNFCLLGFSTSLKGRIKASFLEIFYLMFI